MVGFFAPLGTDGTERLVLVGSRSDHFTILTQSGLVLWTKSFTPSPSPFDQLIREALIEERSATTTTGPVSTWHKDGYALVWTLANELDLVFVVAYQRILHLSYVEDLVVRARRAFVAAYEQPIRAIVDSARGKDVGAAQGKALSGAQGWSGLFGGWDDMFGRLLRELEQGAKVRKGGCLGPREQATRPPFGPGLLICSNVGNGGRFADQEAAQNTGCTPSRRCRDRDRDWSDQSVECRRTVSHPSFATRTARADPPPHGRFRTPLRSASSRG